jgi:hypothetical protein
MNTVCHALRRNDLRKSLTPRAGVFAPKQLPNDAKTLVGRVWTVVNSQADATGVCMFGVVAVAGDQNGMADSSYGGGAGAGGALD